MTTPTSGSRPRPVLIAMSVLASLQVVAGAANLTDLIGDKPAAVFVLLIAAVQVGVAFYVQGIVTPLSSPQAADGRPLVPSPPGVVPPGTPATGLDASDPTVGPADRTEADGEWPPVDPVWRRHGPQL